MSRDVGTTLRVRAVPSELLQLEVVFTICPRCWALVVWQRIDAHCMTHDMTYDGSTGEEQPDGS